MTLRIGESTWSSLRAGFAIAVALLSACDGGPSSQSSVERGAALPSLPEPTESEPFWLSQTGLYLDVARKQLAPELRELEPAHALWSDGLDKRRWLRLPEGTRIDTRDGDHWRFPVGTLLWKEFSREGQRIETRLIAVVGSGARDYWMGAFLWNDDESDARFVPDGERNARGLGHDVPSVKNCLTCHNGEPGRVLGISAVQQPDAPAELLSDPPARPFAAPGDALTSAALGYLHANCGHCHNPRGSARPDTDMDLRLSALDGAPEETRAYRTALDQPLRYFKGPPLRLRVARGDADRSALLYRMMERGPDTQMPPLGTRVTDEAGVRLVRDWIESL